MAIQCRYLTFLMAWLLIGTMPKGAFAQKNDYRTDLLQQIASRTKLQGQIDTLKNGLYEKLAYYKMQPITVIVDKGRITHIGYTIFTPMQRKGFGDEVCNFVERYCLELAIPTIDHFTSSERMKEDRVVSSTGNLSPEYLRSLCCDTTININVQTVNDRGYTIGWRKNAQWIYKIAFPIEYDLLFGTNMDERERRLPDELLRHVVKKNCDTIPQRASLIKAWQDNYYTLKGGAYLLDNLKADQYFEIDSLKKIVPIYNAVYPIESLANLLTTNLVENDYVLNISLRKYGLKTDSLSVSLKTWVDYCRQTGCKPYFGIIRLDDNVAVCELVMHNVCMGYNHIMKIHFNMNTLNSRKGRITARLNSYVTSSRIKNIFDELDTNKK